MGYKPITLGPNLPAAWTDHGNVAGGTGSFGTDTGQTSVKAWSKRAQPSDTGNLVITLSASASSTCWVRIFYLTYTAADIAVALANETDATAASSWATTSPAPLNLAPGDFILNGIAAPTDTLPTFGAESFTMAGVTFGTLNIIDNPVNTAGNDIGGHIVSTTVNTGTVNLAITHNITLTGTTTNWAGCGLYVRLREVAAAATVGKDLGLLWKVKAKVGKALELDWRVEANAQMVDADTASAEGATTPNWFAGDPAYTISRSTIHPSDGTHTWAFTSTDFLDMYVGTGIDPGQWFPIIEGQTYTYCADVSTELAGRDVHLRLLQYTDTEPSAFADIAGSDIITDTTTPQQLIITTTIATGLGIKWARLAIYWASCDEFEAHTADRVGFQPGTSPVFGPPPSGPVAVGKDLGLIWNTRAAINKSVQLVWHVRTPVNKDLGLLWNIRTAAGKSLQTIWSIRAAVGKAVQMIWNTNSKVNKDLSLQWNVRTSTNKDLQLVWNVQQSVGKSLGLIWNVLFSNFVVGKSLGLVWNVRSVAGKDLNLQWNVIAKVAVALQLIWNVLTKSNKDLTLVWKVQQSVGKDLNLVWDVYFQAVWTPVPIPNPTTMTPVIPAATVYTGTGPNASIWTEQVKPTTPWA